MRQLLMTTYLAFGLTPAWAEDAALLLGVERYDDLDRIVEGTRPVDAARALRDIGYTVTAASNPNGAGVERAAQAFQDKIEEADRLIVALSGRFATDGGRTWFLAEDTRDPGLFTVDDRAISLESLLILMAQTPGQSLLLLGTDDDDREVYDRRLRAGIGNLDIPQGVTVIFGRPGEIAELLQDDIVRPGVNVLAQVRRNSRLRAIGYTPRVLVMTPAEEVAVEAAAPQISRTEQVLWDASQRADTESAYLLYLERYPNGRYAEEAEAAIAEIRKEPNRAARLTEEGLNLDRDARRAIQRDLTILDYDTRGIDGIFGPGTRRAITNWQQQNGFAQTSYLTGNQINRLDAQAARRAQELEAEAERQRQLEERRDRAYWEETGAEGDEPGLRAYLERYPDGIFSDVAERALADIEEAKRNRAAAQDRNDWDRARNTDTLAAYRTYLEKRPQGAFREEAQARIRAAQQSDDSANAREQAQQLERGLNLDPISRRLIEARLQQLGLEPGRVDGDFDNQTRRAIRRYQRDRGIDRTGFLNQATVSRLLTDVFR